MEYYAYSVNIVQKQVSSGRRFECQIECLRIYNLSTKRSAGFYHSSGGSTPFSKGEGVGPKFIGFMHEIAMRLGLEILNA